MSRPSNHPTRKHALAIFSTDDSFAELPLVAPPRITPLKPTPVYDTYWWFAAERQQIFFRRLERCPAPWTADPVLRNFKFTNAYRASDRVSQFLIRHVIYRDDLPSDASEIVFRILLFKLFNRIDTWNLLETTLGPITLQDFSVKRYDRALSKAMARGERIYSAAYIMPPAARFGYQRKHRNHLALLEHMIGEDLPRRLQEACSMQRAFDLIRSFPSIGDFLGYQYVTDINYSTVTHFTEMEFVVPGPGALNGIRKCFYDTGGLTDAEVIRFMADRQEIEFKRLGIDYRNLWGRRLQLVDCQNLFCEVDKYARVRHPEFVGKSSRTHIKQRLRPNPEPINFWYPPKWEINTPIAGGSLDGPLAIIASSSAGKATTMDLRAYQLEAAKTNRVPADDDKGTIVPLLGLAGETGELLSEFKKRLRDGDSHVLFRDRFAEELGDLLWYVASLATKLGLDLGEVADSNLQKCQQRWGPLSAAPPFDEGYPAAERFPRRFLVDFSTLHDENEEPVVQVSYKGKQFGDVLTDNAHAKDGYSYHDALHLSFTAVLGWSPLTRKLLGAKRRSNPKVDKVEDGGRAIATEEGLSAMIFAYAKDYNWLDGKSSISTELLRMIQNMVVHLEVSRCTTGEWERAIVDGFKVWREIKQRGGGTLVVNLDERQISLKDA
jgi:NTP pyrophosphatase (non-canonical NTP hydrolase)